MPYFICFTRFAQPVDGETAERTVIVPADTDSAAMARAVAAIRAEPGLAISDTVRAGETGGEAYPDLEAAASAILRMSGWEHGGDGAGFVFHKPTWGSWKAAASWAGDEEREPSRGITTIYATFAACLAAEMADYVTILDPLPTDPAAAGLTADPVGADLAELAADLDRDTHFVLVRRADRAAWLGALTTIAAGANEVPEDDYEAGDTLAAERAGAAGAAHDLGCIAREALNGTATLVAVNRDDLAIVLRLADNWLDGSGPKPVAGAAAEAIRLALGGDDAVAEVLRRKLGPPPPAAVLPGHGDAPDTPRQRVKPPVGMGGGTHPYAPWPSWIRDRVPENCNMTDAGQAIVNAIRAAFGAGGYVVPDSVAAELERAADAFAALDLFVASMEAHANAARRLAEKETGLPMPFTHHG